MFGYSSKDKDEESVIWLDKRLLGMFVQLQGDRKEPLDKGIEIICQRNKEYAKGIFLKLEEEVWIVRIRLRVSWIWVVMSWIGYDGDVIEGILCFNLNLNRKAWGGLSEEGLGDEDDEDKIDNQRIDWVDNHIAIKKEKRQALMIMEWFKEGMFRVCGR
ncbi:hypothetical protein Tco_1563113 [Tanacetum coccineum]